jgi:hypothetical protein
MKIITFFKMEQLNSPRNVEKASDKCPESITKHNLFEKYLFFTQSDVNTYFYKKRTLSDLEFLSYRRGLDNIAKQINPAMAKIDAEFREKLVDGFQDGFSKSYGKKNRFWDIEPQSGDPFGSQRLSPQGFNPFSILSDPLGLKKISECLPDVLDTIGDKLPDTNERQQFLNAFKSFESKVPLVSGFGSEALQSTSDILSGLGNISPIILVTIASAWYAHARSWPSFAFFIACAIYFIIKVPDQLVYLFKLYMNLYDKVPECPDLDMDVIEPQISDNSLELIGSVIATALIGAVGMGSKASASVLVLGFVKDFSRAKLGMIEVAKLVIKFVEQIVNFFRESYLDLPSIKFIDSCSKEIDMFSEDVRLLAFKFNRGSLPMTEATYSEISVVLDVGKHMLKTIPKDKFTEASLRLIHEDCNILRKILVELERSDVTLKGMRQEPVPVLLAGGPGTCKSVAAIYFCHAVVGDVLNENERLEYEINPGPYIYSRKQESVFFDGLTNKAKIVFYDDLLQARDAAGSPACEAMEIIRIINSEEYNAHMAHLENKGNVYLRPKYVVATTNQPDLQSNAIISNIALKRRFKNMSFVVVPKAAYTRTEDLNKDLWSRNIDYSKLPVSTIKGLDYPELKGLEVTDLRPEHLEYHRYDLVTREYGEVLSFDQVVSEARKLEFLKRKQFALHKENFRKFVQKYSSIYDTVVEEFVLPDDYSYDPEVDGDSDEDDDVFIDSLLATRSMRNDVENLLCRDSVYAQKLFDLVSRDRFFSHSDDIVDILLDKVGYRQLMIDIFNRKDYPQDHFVSKPPKKLVVRIRESVQNYVEMFLDMVPSWQHVKMYLIVNAPSIIGVLSFIVHCGLFTMFAKWVYNWWTGKTAPQSFGYSQKLRTPKTKDSRFFKNAAAMKAAMILHPQMGVVPQFGEDSTGIDLIESIARKNCFRFETLSDEGDWRTLGSITFIDGRIGLMPYHFILKLFNGVMEDPERAKRPVRLSHGSDESNPGLLFTVADVIKGHNVGCLADKDLVLIEFPRQFPERKRIVQFFARRNQLEFNNVNLEIVLANVSRNRGLYFGRGKRFSDIFAIDEKHFGVGYTIKESFVYDIPTKSGDCGNLMGILNPSQKEKLFGVHVAGNTHYGDGFSSVVTQEELLEDLKLFAPQIICEEPDFIVPQCDDLEKPLRFEILGRVNRYPMRNTNTAIRKSRMYGSLGDNGLSPAMLRPFLQEGTLIDPLLNAQKKYCQPDILFDHDLVQICCRDYFDHCDWVEKYPVDKRIFSTFEAIYGLDNDVDFGSISSSTSGGWSIDPTGGDVLKKNLFRCSIDTPEWQKFYKEVCKRVDEVLFKAKNNIRMFHAFTDNLKDELREIEKVHLGSTRLFSGSEFIYLVAFRKYFGAFSLWYMKNKIYNGSSIGVNPYSSEWNSIANRLIAISASNILAGDHAKYDGSQKPIAHLFILDEINRWYDDGPDNARIRSILWMEIYNSRHIIDGLIYEWLSGLPSGHPFTIIVNTIYNHMIARYNWCRSMCDMKQLDPHKALELFRDHTYTIAQGDDIAASVHDEYRDLYNDVIFSKYSKELGMNYTNETKSGTVVPLRSLSDIEFLKRSFVYDVRENLFIAPLRLNSILKMVDWTKRKNKNTIVADNVVTALRELSLHNREVYDEYSKKIIYSFKNKYPFLETSEPLDVEFQRRRENVLGTAAYF